MTVTYLLLTLLSVLGASSGDGGLACSISVFCLFSLAAIITLHFCSAHPTGGFLMVGDGVFSIDGLAFGFLHLVTFFPILGLLAHLFLMLYCLLHDCSLHPCGVFSSFWFLHCSFYLLFPSTILFCSGIGILEHAKFSPLSLNLYFYF